MLRSALTGTRIRERRALLGIKQAELARCVEISPSYLNLIEHNRRRIAGKLLADIARELQVDVASLTQGAEAELLDVLRQAAAEVPGDGAEMDRADEFVGRFPGWAALVRSQSRRIHDLQNRVEGLSDRLSHDPRLSSAMHEVLSKVTAIRSAASILVETEDLDEAWQRRFHRNLHGDSLALAESAQSLISFLDGEAEGAEGECGATPWEELEQLLEACRYHFPAEEGPEAAAAPAAPAADAAGPVLECSEAARALLERHLARYRSDAALLPELALRRGLAETGDPFAFAAAAGLPPALVLRRMIAARPVPGSDPAGAVQCDGTGTILLRKSVPGFLVPRSGQGCPLWPLYEALGAPGRPVSRVIAHSSTAGPPMRAWAVAESHWPFGADGPPLTEGWMVLMPMPDATAAAKPLPVGSACRVCVLPDCRARQEPSVLAPGF